MGLGGLGFRSLFFGFGFGIPVNSLVRPPVRCPGGCTAARGPSPGCLLKGSIRVPLRDLEGFLKGLGI